MIDATGRLREGRKLEPWPVYGGWVVVWSQWVRDERGWDQETDQVSPAVYPTEAECQAAIKLMRARAL